MKVLLATPPWDFSEIYPAAMGKPGGVTGGRFGTITGVTEPLGMLYLAAVLRREGREAAIHDGYLGSADTWIKQIAAYEPDILGMTLSAFSFDKVTPLLPVLKKALPRLKIVVGGPYPNALGAVVLEQAPDIDYVVMGDGELIMPELVRAIESGAGAVPELPGLYHRDGGSPAGTGRAKITDLDSLPLPARELVDMGRYRPSVGFYNRLPSASIITTRGCPRECAFCISDSDITYRSVESVIDEIRWCKKQYGIRHVVFWDEDIAVKKNRAWQLSEAILEADLDISWCASMVTAATDPALLKLMKRAGCWKLLFGLESGVQKNLDSLDKRLDLQKVAAQLTAVKRAGIETFATFMFGIPGETRSEADQTIKFASGLPLDYALFLNFTPFPGTSYFYDLDKYGEFQGIWSTQTVSFVPHSMTKADLEELRAISYRRFYLRAGYIMKRALDIRGFEDIKRNFRGLVATLKLKPADVC